MFVFRQQAGAHLDAELLADGLRRARVVARQHDGPDSGVLQQFQPRLGVGARLVAHGDGADDPAVAKQDGDRLALIAQGGDQGGLSVGQRCLGRGGLGGPEEDLRGINRAGDALAPDGG